MSERKPHRIAELVGDSCVPRAVVSAQGPQEWGGMPDTSVVSDGSNHLHHRVCVCVCVCVFIEREIVITSVN